MQKVSEISLSFCRGKLRGNDCLASKDATIRFKEHLDMVATKFAKQCAVKCLERGRKTVSPQDVSDAFTEIDKYLIH